MSLRVPHLVFVPLVACAPGTDGPSDTDTDAGPRAADNFGVEETLGVPGCDNLLLSDCLYPYPSGAYVASEGDRTWLALPPEGMPTTAGGVSFRTDTMEAFSAFGAASPVLFRWPGAVLPDDATVFDPSPSLRDDARTILIDATTGARIPHWVETDHLADRGEHPVFTLRPSVPLPRGTEIVVGLRGWLDEDGAPMPAPEPFAALRDATASTWIGVHDRRAHFESVVFPTLEAAGFDRDALQLAWSFPVQSADTATATLVSVRDAVLDALPDTGPDYTIQSVLDCDGQEDPSGCHPSIRVILDGVIHVPSVLLPADDLGVRRLRLDDDGLPVVDGTEDWPFRLQLPHSAFQGDEPVPVLQYGHGLLGSIAEANNGWLREMADRLGFAILSTSLQGMHSPDTDIWLQVLLQDGGRFPELAEPAYQGIANQLALQRLVGTSLATDDEPLLQRGEDGVAWDPDTVWYYGNSQGGSVGTVMMALSQDVTRGVLGVPGSGYPLLLQRSSAFSGPLFDSIALLYPEPDAISRFLALIGTGWDGFDPLTFAPRIHGDLLPDTPSHAVLLHVAKEDRQVQNEPSFILGRATGAVLMTPAVRTVPLLDPQPYPATLPATLVEVDFSLPADPTPRDPVPERPDEPDGGDPHGWLRQYLPAQDQMVTFLRTGEVLDVCDGVPCVTDGEP